MVRTGVFPGSFDPLTVAHLGVAEAARRQLELDVVELVISSSALAKPAAGHSPVSERVRVIAERPEPWLAVRLSDQQLLADLAEGADACIVGADKAHQLLDSRFYDSPDAMRAALARLPVLAVATRHGVDPVPEAELAAYGIQVVPLDVAGHLAEVSSTAVRDGAGHWLAPNESHRPER